MQQVLDSVESIDQLEILLALADTPRRPYPASELLERTRVDRGELREIQEHLAAKGLVVQDEDGSIELSDEAHVVIGARELRRRYRENPAQVVRPLIHRAVERVREIAGRALTRAVLYHRPGKR